MCQLPKAPRDTAGAPAAVQPVAPTAATIRRVTVPKWKAMGRWEASIVTIQGSARSAVNGWIAGAVEE